MNEEQNTDVFEKWINEQTATFEEMNKAYKRNLRREQAKVILHRSSNLIVLAAICVGVAFIEKKANA